VFPDRTPDDVGSSRSTNSLLATAPVDLVLAIRGMSERVCEQAGCRVGLESDALLHWSQGNRWEGHPEWGQQRHGVRR